MRVDVKKFEYSMDPDSDRVSFGIAAGFFTAGSIEPVTLHLNSGTTILLERSREACLSPGILSQ
jgi:hypothetical protein